jgi:hypothetical protein
MWRWLAVGDGDSASVCRRVPAISGDQKVREEREKDQ